MNRVDRNREHEMEKNKIIEQLKFYGSSFVLTAAAVADEKEELLSFKAEKRFTYSFVLFLKLIAIDCDFSFSYHLNLQINCCYRFRI